MIPAALPSPPADAAELSSTRCGPWRVALPVVHPRLVSTERVCAQFSTEPIDPGVVTVLAAGDVPVRSR
jgi:hypothetical protein